MEVYDLINQFYTFMKMLKVSVTIRTEVRLLKKQKVLFLTPGRRHNN